MAQHCYSWFYTVFKQFHNWLAPAKVSSKGGQAPDVRLVLVRASSNNSPTAAQTTGVARNTTMDEKKEGCVGRRWDG